MDVKYSLKPFSKTASACRVKGALRMQPHWGNAQHSLQAFFARLAADPPGQPPPAPVSAGPKLELVPQQDPGAVACAALKQDPGAVAEAAPKQEPGVRKKSPDASPAKGKGKRMAGGACLEHPAAATAEEPDPCGVCLRLCRCCA